MKKLGTLIICLSIVFGIALLTYGIVCSIKIDQNCIGHLKRAADANTIELARQELSTAVDYMEQNGLTTGSTHILYSMPNCDLGFWHENLKASLSELEAMPTDADRLTVSNQLIKLRETIMDHGKKGTSVTQPPNVHVFPNQVMYRALAFGNLLLLSAGLLLVASYSEGCNQPKQAAACQLQ